MSQQNKSIFRQEALDNLQSIETVIDTLQVVQPAAWLALLAATLALCSIIIWAAFGKLNLTIESPAVILMLEQVNLTEKMNEKTLTEHKEIVNELYDLYNKKNDLFKNQFITRIDLQKSKDDYLTAKENIYLLEKELSMPMLKNNALTNAQSPLIALAFIHYKQGKKITPGMSVQLSANSSFLFESYSTGTIESISMYPVSKTLAYSYLKNNSFADSFFYEGAPFMAKIVIKPNEQSTKLQPGQSVIAKIHYRTCTPFQLLSKRNLC